MDCDEEIEDLTLDVLYKVCVVKIINPHLFWLELVQKKPSRSAKPIVVQGGLMGTWCLETHAQENTLQLEWAPSPSWTDIAISVFVKTLRDSDVLYFKPIELMSKEYSLIDGIRCFCGQLYTYKNGEFNIAAKTLYNKALAYKNSLLSNAKVNLNCDPQILRDAKKVVLEYTGTKSQAKVNEPTEVITARNNLSKFLTRKFQNDGSFTKEKLNSQLRDLEEFLEQHPVLCGKEYLENSSWLLMAEPTGYSCPADEPAGYSIDVPSDQSTDQAKADCYSSFLEGIQKRKSKQAISTTCQSPLYFPGGLIITPDLTKKSIENSSERKLNQSVETQTYKISNDLTKSSAQLPRDLITSNSDAKVDLNGGTSGSFSKSSQKSDIMGGLDFALVSRNRLNHSRMNSDDTRLADAAKIQTAINDHERSENLEVSDLSSENITSGESTPYSKSGLWNHNMCAAENSLHNSEPTPPSQSSLGGTIQIPTEQCQSSERKTKKLKCRKPFKFGEVEEYNESKILEEFVYSTDYHLLDGSKPSPDMLNKNKIPQCSIEETLPLQLVDPNVPHLSRVNNVKLTLEAIFKNISTSKGLQDPHVSISLTSDELEKSLLNDRSFEKKRVGEVEEKDNIKVKTNNKTYKEMMKIFKGNDCNSENSLKKNIVETVHNNEDAYLSKEDPTLSSLCKTNSPIKHSQTNITKTDLKKTISKENEKCVVVCELETMHTSNKIGTWADQINIDQLNSPRKVEAFELKTEELITNEVTVPPQSPINMDKTCNSNDAETEGKGIIEEAIDTGTISSEDDPELAEDYESKEIMNSSFSSLSSLSEWQVLKHGLVSRQNISLGSSNFLPLKNQHEYIDLQEFDEQTLAVDANHFKLSTDDAESETCSIFRDRVTFDSLRHMELCSGDNLVDSITNPRVIIHSKSGEICSPWRELSTTMFSKPILSNLKKMNIQVPRKVQSCVWPIVSRGGSTFVVAPPNSGKDLAILAPVCSQICTIKLMDKQSCSPLVLVLCADTKKARCMQATCEALLKDCKTRLGRELVVLRIDDCEDPNVVYKFFKDCDVLISTPRCVASCLQYNIKILNLETVEFLYLNNVDILDQRFSRETNCVIDFVQKQSVESHGALKVYATSSVWCDILRRIGTESSNPSLVITALQECAFYSGLKLQVRFVLQPSKLRELEELLKGTATAATKRTVIVCASDKEVAQVAEVLKASNHSVLQADSTMPLDSLNNVRQSWKQYANAIGELILVCLDDNLQFLNIANANHLINFSLPKVLSVFNLRFQTMMNNFPNLYADEKEKPELKVDIFIDEHNGLQLPKITQFVKRFKVQIPEEVNALLKLILKLNDEKKVDMYVPICDRLMGSGDCSDMWSCVERHCLHLTRDRPAPWIPRAGIVKCKVIYVHHTGLYSARLLTHTDLNGVETTVQQMNLRIAIEMAAYCSFESKLHCHGNPKVGDLCAVKVNQSFERCQVIKIVKVKDKNQSDFILLNLLEEESYIWKNAYDLMHLPDHLKKMQSKTIRIRLAGLKPTGGKEHWSTASIHTMVNMLCKDNVMLKGRIVLGIGNTLLLDNLQVIKRLETLRLDAVSCNLKQFLLKEYAVENLYHLSKLYEFCHSYNYDLPQFSRPIPVVPYKQHLPRAQWAHLNEGDYTEVYFNSAVNPHSFFVRVFSHNNSLEDMESDIQVHVSELKKKLIRLPKNITDDMIASTFYCFAKFPDDDRYYRARIENKVHDSGSEQYNCFFVDQGDWKTVNSEDLFPINSKFITRMPFQAIECRLHGLIEPEGGWTNEATDFLYNLCFENASDDLLKILLLKHFSKQPALITNGNKYDVLLMDKHCQNSFLDSFVLNKMAIADDAVKSLVQMAKEEIESIFNRAESTDSDSEDVDTPDSIPNIILNHIMVPNTTNSVGENELVGNLAAWNDLFTDFDTCDDLDEDLWDCTLDKEELQRLQQNFNIPGLYPPTRLPQINENSEPSNPNGSVHSDEDFTVVNKSDVEANLTGKFFSPHNKIYSKPDHKTPAIVWYQNDNYIIVRVKIPDVSIYECKIDLYKLFLETCYDGDLYKVDIQLYSAVVPAASSHVSKGSHILLRLKKMMMGRCWTSLTADGCKDQRIMYDHDHIYIESEPSNLIEEKNRSGDFISEDEDEEEVEVEPVEDDMRIIYSDAVNQMLLEDLTYDDEND